MSNSLAIPSKENFPTLVGDIQDDTASLIGELKVGDVVVERGWARLYLIWLTKAFLKATIIEHRCPTCFLIVDEGVESCPRCGSHIVQKEQHLYPTLETYVQFIADNTGKSRQTIFNRLSTYRSLADEKGVDPASVFSLNLLSPGAARKLAKAEGDQDGMKLVNESWQDTVNAALTFEKKSESLAFVRHDILNEPKMSASFTSMDDDEITVYREAYPVEGDLVLEEYKFVLEGDWPDYMKEWIGGKVNAKQYVLPF